MRASWHKEDIKAEIRKRGSNLFVLAKMHGLSRRTMCEALCRRLPTYHDVIVEFLGVPHHELWPHWYDENGLRGRTRPDARTKRRACPSYKAADAARMAG